MGERSRSYLQVRIGMQLWDTGERRRRNSSQKMAYEDFAVFSRYIVPVTRPQRVNVAKMGDGRTSSAKVMR